MTIAKVKLSTIDTPAQGVLFTARQHKAMAWKRVKRIREQIREAGICSGNLRLECLKAEISWREYQDMERGALNAIERRANELGLTARKSA